MGSSLDGETHWVTTYVTGDELRSVGSNLLYGEKDVDLLFLLYSLKDEVCRAEEP